MKHFEVNFVDGTVETVMSEAIPLAWTQPLFRKNSDGSLEEVPIYDEWWHATLLTLDDETKTKLVPYGRIHININNVTFIKET